MHLIERQRGFLLLACVCAILSVPYRVGLAGTATVKSVEINDPKTVALVKEQYTAAIRWPSENEKVNNVATPSEIRAAIPSFEKWVRRVLSKKYIPTDLSAHVFGLKSWRSDGGGEDVLFAQYELNDRQIRIRDTSAAITVRVVRKKQAEGAADYEQFVRNEFREYFNRSERLLGFKSLYVVHLGNTDIRRIDVMLPAPKAGEEFTELWRTGNPHRIWCDNQSICAVVRKTLGIDDTPEDEDYGVAQRFPPLRTRLKTVRTLDLVNYFQNERSPRSRHVILGAIEERRDSAVAIPGLIAIYQTAPNTDEELKMALIQTLGFLAKNGGEASRARVRQLGEKSLQDEGEHSRIFSSVLKNVLQSLDEGKGNGKPKPGNDGADK